MTCDEALARMARGEKMTRNGMDDEFLLISGGSLVRGSHIGETAFTRVHAYALTDEDRLSCDWHPFKQIIPDDWEGCSLPEGPAPSLRGTNKQ